MATLTLARAAMTDVPSAVAAAAQRDINWTDVLKIHMENQQ